MPSTDLTALILPAPGALPVWGRSPAERAVRQLTPLNVAVLQGEDVPAGKVALLLVRGDAIFHQSVLRGMRDTPGVALVDDSGQPLAVHLNSTSGTNDFQTAREWLQNGGAVPPGLRRVAPTDVADLYNAALRRRDDPYALRINQANLPALEKRIFLATYKGVTDLVTKYWWPVPARIVTGWCVRLGLSPNFVTCISGLLAVAVCFAFARGHHGLGLAMAWPMIFLDTVDGKLARVTLTSSKFGNLFDHGIDLLHPPFWYYTWGLGLAGGSSAPDFWPLMWVILGGYAVGRLCEGYFTRRFGFHVHVWRQFDSGFRLVLARRNPNLILMTVAWLVGRPDVGLWLIAGWTVVSLAVQLVQTFQSTMAARHGPLRSWLEFPAPQSAK